MLLIMSSSDASPKLPRCFWFFKTFLEIVELLGDSKDLFGRLLVSVTPFTTSIKLVSDLRLVIAHELLRLCLSRLIVLQTNRTSARAFAELDLHRTRERSCS
jgi:hypothetical protein